MTTAAAGRRLGRPRLHLRTVGSTNDRARALAAAGAPHGTLVSADEQTSGRGRQGRGWSTPPGAALAASFVLREHDALLPLRAGLAVADLAGATARVKWPNDVLVDGRKVAGILAESRPGDGWSVLGIGVNLALDEAALAATGARAGNLGGRRGAADALAELVTRVSAWLGAEAPAAIAALRQRDALLGLEIGWSTGADAAVSRGIGAGIADDGALLVRRHGEDPDAPPLALRAGEVHLVAAP